MNKKRDEIIKKCPVSGLTVISKPEWTNVSFETNYFRVSFELIGSEIIRSKLWGYSQFFTIEKYINMLEVVANETLAGKKQFILIEDYSEMQGASARANKYYINYHKKNIRLKAIIISNAEDDLKIVNKLIRPLESARFPVVPVKSYEKAIKLAIDIQNNKADIKTLRANISEVYLNHAEIINVNDEETGATISEYSHWVDYQIDEKFFITIKTINDSILSFSLKGIPKPAKNYDIPHLKELFFNQTKFKPDQYIEIIDISDIEADKKALDSFFENYFTATDNRILCSVLFPSIDIKTFSQNLIFADNFTEALKVALTPEVYKKKIEDTSNSENESVAAQKITPFKFDIKEKISNLSDYVNRNSYYEVNTSNILSEFDQALSKIQEQLLVELKKKDNIIKILQQKTALQYLRAEIWKQTTNSQFDLDKLVKYILKSVGEVIGFSQISYCEKTENDSAVVYKKVHSWSVNKQADIQELYLPAELHGKIDKSGVIIRHKDLATLAAKYNIKQVIFENILKERNIKSIGIFEIHNNRHFAFEVSEGNFFGWNKDVIALIDEIIDILTNLV